MPWYCAPWGGLAARERLGRRARFARSNPIHPFDPGQGGSAGGGCALRGRETGLDPLRLLRSKRWLDGGQVVADGPVVGASVIGPVESSLKIERDVWVAGQERDGDQGQSRLKFDRIDEEIRGMIGAVYANMIIEQAGRGDGQVERDGCRMHARAEEIDLDEMDRR